MIGYVIGNAKININNFVYIIVRLLINIIIINNNIINNNIKWKN